MPKSEINALQFRSCILASSTSRWLSFNLPLFCHFIGTKVFMTNFYQNSSTIYAQIYFIEATEYHLKYHITSRTSIFFFFFREVSPNFGLIRKHNRSIKRTWKNVSETCWKVRAGVAIPMPKNKQVKN